MTENFPILAKETDIQVQEAQRVPNKMNPNRPITRHTEIKMPKVKDKEILGCFQYLAIVNCAAMNIGVHRFFWMGVSGFLGYNSGHMDQIKGEGGGGGGRRVRLGWGGGMGRKGTQL